MNPAPDDPAQFQEQAATVSSLYLQAAALHEHGTHLICCDEKTGMQALQRLHASKPAAPGFVERIEEHYIRRGTQCLTANLEVATGRILTPTLASTRNEEDFANHILRTLSTDLDGEWIFIIDNLNTHKSESLVHLVAELCDLDQELGVKGRGGIMRSTTTRAAFLADSTHRIRFVYTPKRASWLNQVELWFSILARRLLKRASFTSVDDLNTRVMAFIDYFNLTIAKPFKWTYTGRPLVA
ncbi:MAG: IS630 family transposase [Gemmatimonadetes bacterium]|nr:IS630 family transposase [Gemmatimonadota bacterium]MBT6146561.1 IS630 family transposase [Gemmatimonadota bacterium]